MNARSILRSSSWICLIGGGLVLGGYAFLQGQAQIDQARDQARLASLFMKGRPVPRPGPARAIPLAESVPKTGAVLGELVIPRIGVDLAVLQGDSSGILRRSVGHIPGTAMPNRPGGNVGIAGHRDTYFRPLKSIRAGDIIMFKTPAGRYRYRVQSTRVVEPNDVDALDSNGHSMLTLVTCYPFYFVGPAPHRFIVQARQIPSE